MSSSHAGGEEDRSMSKREGRSGGGGSWGGMTVIGASAVVDCNSVFLAGVGRDVVDKQRCRRALNGQGTRLAWW